MVAIDWKVFSVGPKSEGAYDPSHTVYLLPPAMVSHLPSQPGLALTSPELMSPDWPAPLTQLLPKELLEQLSHRPILRTQTLFRQGSKPRYMYFIAHGEVVLERHGPEGENAVVQRVRQGFLAEASLDARTYHCDARVTADGAAWALALSPLQQALQQDSAFAQRWIGMLAAQIRQARARCERLTLKGVEARIWHMFDTEGRQGKLYISSSLKQFAADLGVTHEALYRALGRMEREGHIVRRQVRAHAIAAIEIYDHRCHASAVN